MVVIFNIQMPTYQKICFYLCDPSPERIWHLWLVSCSTFICALIFAVCVLYLYTKRHMGEPPQSSEKGT